MRSKSAIHRMRFRFCLLGLVMLFPLGQTTVAESSGAFQGGVRTKITQHSKIRSVSGTQARAWQLSAGMYYGLAWPGDELNDVLPQGSQWGAFVKTEIPCLPKVVSTYALNFFHMKFEAEDSAGNLELFVNPVLLVAHIRPFYSAWPVEPYLRLGGGVALETLNQGGEEQNNTDPAFLAGIGLEYLLGKIEIKIEGDLQYIYQKYIENAELDGMFVSLRAGVGYRF